MRLKGTNEMAFNHFKLDEKETLEGEVVRFLRDNGSDLGVVLKTLTLAFVLVFSSRC